MNKLLGWVSGVKAPKKYDEFRTYTVLGSEGLDHIATVYTPIVEAESLTTLLNKTSPTNRNLFSKDKQK